jgi:dihydrofolate reductase
VVSQTLRTAEWNNSTVLEGDVAKQAAHLREQYNEISVWGSSSLIPTLLREALIDEFVLLTYPIVVGSGKRLFNGDTPLGLELTHTTTSGSGVVICTYRRADSVSRTERKTA